MLAAGARRCWRDRSQHSSANNHLVGELAGLAVVAMLLPELAGASRWERDAVAALAVEADRQVLPDGVGAEQAVGYQVFTAELLARGGCAACGPRAARRRRRDAGRGVGRAPATSPTWSATATRAPPRATTTRASRCAWTRARSATVRRHLALVAALTGIPGRPARGPTDLTSAWIATRLGSGLPRRPRPRARVRRTPRRRAGRPARRRRRVTVDVGPLGYLAIAAHGHADALAVEARRRRPRPRSATRAPAATTPTPSGAPRTAAPARTPRSPSTTPTSR